MQKKNIQNNITNNESPTNYFFMGQSAIILTNIILKITKLNDNK